MRIRRLELKNFGPYRGEFKLDFGSKDEKNLWIIWGQNGSGKTHIFKAIKWCLYGCDPPPGSQKMRYGTERDAWEFIYGTHVGDRPPEPYMHVTLCLEVDSADSKKTQQYIVKRSVFPSSQNPTNYTQISCDFEVIKDGRRSDVPIEEIESLLPIAASQFFMFHGEEIREMSQKHTEQTGKAIELIIDAETFRQGKEDLVSVAQDVENDLDDERRKSGGIDDLLDLKKKLQEKIQSLESECLLCKTEIAEKKGQLESVDMELAKNEASRIVKEGLDLWTQRLRSNEEERKKILGRRENLINDLPSKLLLLELERVLNEKEERQKKREAQWKEISELKGALQLTIGAEKLKQCPICRTIIADRERAHIENERKAVEGKITKLEAAIEEEDPTYYEIRDTVSKIRGSSLDFEQFKKDLAENALAHDEIESNITKLKEQLSDSKIREVQSLMAERDRLLTDIGRAQERLGNFIADLEEQKKRRDGALKMMEGKGMHDNVRRNLEKQYDLATRCLGAFEDLLGRLSEVRRSAIEGYSSRIFGRLTNKSEEYEGIEIDEQYNVSVTDKHKNIVKRTKLSTGEKEVVALSFILGLKTGSEKLAPLVLDTFFTNLDGTHTENIVKALPTFADQVILILTDSEYNTLKTIAPNSFFDRIALVWNTVRIQPEERSEIKIWKETGD